MHKEDKEDKEEQMIKAGYCIDHSVSIRTNVERIREYWRHKAKYVVYLGYWDNAIWFRVPMLNTKEVKGL